MTLYKKKVPIKRKKEVCIRVSTIFFDSKMTDCDLLLSDKELSIPSYCFFLRIEIDSCRNKITNSNVQFA